MARRHSTDPPSLRRAVAAYEQAVALDSTFAEAWTQLSHAHASLYGNSMPTPAEAEASRRAAERASALAPDSPESHHAWAVYYANVRGDNRRSFVEDSTALSLEPGNADLLASVSLDELTLGRWDEARAHLEQAARLDPRSARVARALGLLLLYVRDYAAAQQAYNRALTLTPGNLGLIERLAMVALQQGDLAGAREVLRAAPGDVDPTALVSYLAVYQDLMWVLDDDQQALLLRLGVSAFDNDAGNRGIVFAQTLALRGDQARARAYADTARQAIENLLRDAPNDAQQHVFHGLALAYMGRKAEAIQEGERGVALYPITRDALNAPYMQLQLVRILILTGEPEKALDHLEPLLKIPFYLSPGWLKIDPNFAPLRGNPRFERLVAGK